MVSSIKFTAVVSRVPPLLAKVDVRVKKKNFDNP